MFNNEMKQELRQILKDNTKSIVLQVEANFEILNIKLDNLSKDLNHLDSTVDELKRKVYDIETIKIRKLEDNALKTSTIKKWLVSSVAITGTIVGIIFTLLRILVP